MPFSAAFLKTFLYSQLFVTPPYPTHDFSGQTVIVTGSNTGLGFEAARHFARLNCAKLILAVRTISKGEKAKESILESTKRTSDCIEVWPLDQTSSESVKTFAKQAQSLDRIDVLVANAGIQTPDFKIDEDHESTIKVNVISTFLLALLLLPKMRETAGKYQSTPHLEIVSSEVHHIPDETDVKISDLYATLNEREKWPKESGKRYPISKLLQVLVSRELVVRSADKPVITIVNPGLCYSEFTRYQSSFIKFVVGSMQRLIGRTTEVGARTLVAGAYTGPQSHGEFMSDSENQEVESWILTSEGQETQKEVFDQTLAELERIEPGLSKNI